MAAVITTKKLSATVGAEVLDVDRDRLLRDPDLPHGVLDALEEHGVLVFREIGVDDEEQVAFGRRLGDLVTRPGYPIPEINVITQTPDNPMAEYLKGNAQWHIDGALDDIPSKAGILSARVITAGDSGTEFASTYAAYDDLSDEEREQSLALRVLHSFEASQLLRDPKPPLKELARWRKRPTKVHPLVWHHQSGRRSLVLGATTERVEGMTVEEGRAFLDGLLARATRPDRVYRHEWEVGDLVIWDNRGVLHRALPYDASSPREMHRTTIAGDEPIQ